MFYGFLVGYLIATLWESLIHQYVGHATKSCQHFLERHVAFCWLFSRTCFQHDVIHHKKTFLDHYFIQFLDEEERDALHRWLVVQSIMSDKYFTLIQQEKYGLTLKGSGIISFFAPVIIVPPLCGWLVGWSFASGVSVMLLIPVLLSKYIHPYLHMPLEYAMCRASPIQSLVLRSAFGRFLYSYHYLHHQHPSMNFNLFPGGDMLRGRFYRATKQEQVEMKQLGLPIHWCVANLYEGCCQLNEIRAINGSFTYS